MRLSAWNDSIPTDAFQSSILKLLGTYLLANKIIGTAKVIDHFFYKTYAVCKFTLFMIQATEFCASNELSITSANIDKF